ncbi:MAG: hypothetical protein ACNYPI_12085 [Arenicellales bacterium WSBS_2016_MAG_OTU3]
MERICEHLETLANNTNWRDTDWRKVDKEVRNAKRDWYQKPELDAIRSTFIRQTIRKRDE